MRYHDKKLIPVFVIVFIFSAILISSIHLSYAQTPTLILNSLTVGTPSGKTPNIGTDPIKITLSWTDSTGSKWQVFESGNLNAVATVIAPASKSAVLESLEKGIAHCYTVKRIDPSNGSTLAESNSLCSHVQPVISIVQTGASQVTITWTQASATNPAGNPNSYTVERVLPSSSSTTISEVCIDGSPLCATPFTSVSPSSPSTKTHIDNRPVALGQYVCYEVQAAWASPRINMDSDKKCITISVLDNTPPTAAITYSTPGPYKSGDIVTITATFNEPVKDSPIPQISISGANTLAAANMVKTSSTVYTYSRTIDEGDGTATVAMAAAQDLAGNPIVSAPTSGATHTIDNTPPTAAITYSTPGPYKSGDIVTITATFNEPVKDSPIPQISISGANTLAAANMVKTSSTVYTYSRTIDEGDGTATVAMAAAQDLAGNPIVSAPTSGATHTINPTPVITITPIAVNPKWGINFVVSGTIIGAGDNVMIDWGDATPQTAATLTPPSYSGSHTYSAAAIGSKTITAYFKSGPITIATSSPINTSVEKHQTTLSIKLPTSVVEGSSVTASGILNDADTGKGIPLKPISLSDAPANIIADSTTNGVQFTSGPTMKLVFCSTCTPNPGSVLVGANILHVFTGTVITFPPKSAEVTFLLEDMATNAFTATVAPSGGSPFNISSAGAAPDIQLLQLALNGGTITITNSDPITGVGISSVRIDDPAADPKNLFNENFDSFAISECNPCTSLLLGGGNYFSTGLTTSGISVSEPVTATSAEDSLYLGSSANGSYAKETDTLTGVGGSTTFTATPSSGAVYTALVCSASDPDTDGDSLCNSWEGAGKGVPYSVTFGGVKTNFLYALPSSNPNAKNVYVEYDYMTGHNLLAAAKTSLSNAFTAHSITFSLDDTTDSAVPIPHLENINAWFDNDSVRTNDFDSLKALYFGSPSERPTVSVGTYTLQNGATLTPSIRGAGIAITTPAGASTQGTIIIKERINLVAPLTSTSVLTITPPTAPSIAGVEFGTPSSTTTASGTSRVVVTKIPFATTASKSFTLPNIDTKVTLPLGTITLGGGQVAVTTTKLEAKAQAYHYGMGVHAIGSNGCNSPTGLAEPLGNDFITALGCTPLGESNPSHNGPEGTAEEQSGTILHELGHNFNLAHGGPSKILATSAIPADKDQNCKPNHISVMNYARQLPQPLGYLAPADWRLDFSSGLFSAAPLGENNLNEAAGLKSSSTTAPKIVWAAIARSSAVTPVTIKTGVSTPSNVATPTSINWDNDGLTSETVADKMDINNFGIVGCPATPTADGSTLLLKDYDEWNNLQFDFRTATGAQALDGSHLPPFKTPEPTTELGEDVQNSLVSSGLLEVPLRPDTITPSKDSYLRKLVPNVNEGKNTVLFVTYLGSDRALIAFDQGQIAEAVAGKSLQSATLKMYIKSNLNGWGSGGDIESRPLTATWTEGNGYNENFVIPVKGTGSGVTWNCAVDTNINNSNKDCVTAWNGGTFGAVSSKVKITNGKTGWISFDVTGNVNSFLGGTANNGWIVKKSDESKGGLITFASRESLETRPELVLTFVP